ncbi:YciI family protein [Paraburkholderia sp. C35]|uniref:YciI family protein n=1 Tax=Paraburkholderia sp. C35 TaxID=2126993 RepID=UPI0013A5B7AC|nr:YciI family protein [Paraburkholderia sp. C35]
MKFVNLARYVLDADKVASARPSHRAYAKQLLDTGKLIAAGPLGDNVGGLFVYEASDINEVWQMIRHDPYNIAGVYEKCEVYQWSIAGVNVGLLSAHD